MAPPSIPKRAMHKDNVFFSAEWTRSMDCHFITLLLQLKEEGFWKVGKKNERASVRAIGMYNGMCRTNFDINFGLERVRKLHKRYKVFTWVIQRPWVTYDGTTHVVTCPDTVWKVLYDQQMLVAPYINEGEHSDDALKALFHPVEEVAYDNSPVIQISNDTKTFTEDDSSVMEVPNPYGSTLTGSHRSSGSSMNTDSVFYNELAWNYSDSETEKSFKSNDSSTGMSATNPMGKVAEGRAKGRFGCSGKDIGKGQSSCASWSPFKKK